MTVTPLFDSRTSSALSRQTRAEIAQGVKLSLPMTLGYLPLGFTFGAVALGAGMPPALACLMSVVVYAPSLQLLAVQLLLARAPLSSLMATGLICNARHILMSAALAPYLRRFNRVEQMFFGWQLCDEAFALQSTELDKGPPRRARTFAINASMHVAFVIGTLVAAVVHASPDDLRRVGLDFAPIAMFIAMLSLLLKDRLQIFITLCAGIVAVLLSHTVLRSWGMIVGTMTAATLGTCLQLWAEKRKAQWSRVKSSSPSLA